jgi:pantothenate kinase
MQALVDEMLKLTRSGHRVILGLAGPPGAGKSTLAGLLVDAATSHLGERSVGLVPLDGFHLSNSQLQRLGRRDRKGAPDTFDVWGYLALLRRVLDNPAEDVYVAQYDRTLHEPIASRLVVFQRAKLIVAEGNYLALDQPGWRDVGALMSELWYVEAPDEVRQERLIARQVAAGLDQEQAREWVYRNDWANGELVKPTRSRCSRVVTCPRPAQL